MNIEPAICNGQLLYLWGRCWKGKRMGSWMQGVEGGEGGEWGKGS